MKQSPYYMLYQQHMRLPIDAEVLPKVDVDLQGLCDEDQKQTNEAIEALLQLWQKPFKKAEVNIAAAQKQRKETYESSISRVSYQKAVKCCWRTKLRSGKRGEAR